MFTRRALLAAAMLAVASNVSTVLVLIVGDSSFAIRGKDDTLSVRAVRGGC